MSLQQSTSLWFLFLAVVSLAHWMLHPFPWSDFAIVAVLFGMGRLAAYLMIRLDAAPVRWVVQLPLALLCLALLLTLQV